MTATTLDRLRARLCAPRGFPAFCVLLGADIAPCHKAWCDFRRGRDTSLTLAPRGHGKTTILTIGYALWKLAQDPETRILIVSNTASQAKRFLREIKGHVQANDVLRAVFPHMTPPHVTDRLHPWADLEMSLASKSRNTKEPNITARGIDGDIIGMHYDVILLDDIVDEENARSPVQRENLSSWWGMTLVPTLEPGGEMHVVGTRYHYQDLYGDLIGDADTRGPWAMNTIVSRAIGDTGEPLWSQKFSLAELAHRREELGTVRFNAQYQNDVQAMKGALFKPEWFQYYADAPAEAHLESYIGVDLAIGRGDRHDYTAIVTIGVDQRSGRIWVLDSWRGRVSFEQQLRRVQAMYQKWRRDARVGGPHVVAVEEVAYQAAFTQELAAHTMIPVRGVRPTADKVTRAHALSVHMENGKVLMRNEDRLLEDELLLFPEGDHDDLVDALVYAVDTAMARSQPLYYGGGMAVA